MASMYLRTCLLSSFRIRDIELQLVMFPTLEYRNLATSSSTEASDAPVCARTSFTRTVLNTPVSRSCSKVSSPSGSTMGSEPVRRYCMNLLPFSPGWSSRNSENDSGRILSSMKRPDRYVESSDERRYALDPVMYMSASEST